MASIDHYPNREPAEARACGRYVFENDEHVGMIARAATTKRGAVLTFDEAWARHQTLAYGASVRIAVPTVADLILTKEWAMRTKDVIDIQLLEALRAKGGGDP
jgi:hypothetical protein